jgi:hypothetical protein
MRKTRDWYMIGSAYRRYGSEETALAAARKHADKTNFCVYVGKSEPIVGDSKHMTDRHLWRVCPDGTREAVAP